MVSLKLDVLNNIGPLLGEALHKREENKRPRGGSATTQFGDFRPRKHLLISCQAEKLLFFLEGRCLFNASNGNTKDSLTHCVGCRVLV
jgi:hypothetical protein